MDGSDAIFLPETDVTEALYAQQQLLQQLHAELDAEREASETAASEALSMILRLQGEKASLKMEASQYKRMAEEKMCHAEEALDIFEDLIYQREMEIASLEFQVQAYRHRLLSMGCNDLGVYENKFPENLLMQRTETLSGEKGASNSMWRMSSLPIQIKDSNQSKSSNDRKRSAITSPDSIPIVVGESASQEVKDLDKKPMSSSSADLNYYWEQIKKLDGKVKEISENKDSGRNKSAISRAGSWSPSLFSQASIGTSICPTRGGTGSNNPDKVKLHDSSQEKLDLQNSSSSSTVQDIFEVPCTTKIQKPCIPRKKDCSKLTVDGEKNVGKLHVIGEDALKPPNKDEKGQVKTMLLPTSHEKKLPKPRGGMIAEGNVSPVQLAVGSVNSQAEFQQLRQRVELLERRRNSPRPEITAAGNEELGLLKEINEQLKSLHSEIRSWRIKQPPTRPKDEPSLDLLSEAMLYFWM